MASSACVNSGLTTVTSPALKKIGLSLADAAAADDDDLSVLKIDEYW